MKAIPDFSPDIELGRLLPNLKPAIVTILEDHIGRDNSICGKALLAHLVRHGFHTDQRRMRLAISALRRSGILICSAPGRDGGYYMPESRDEFEDFLHAEYLAKIADMTETLHAMQAAANRQFMPKQLDLL